MGLTFYHKPDKNNNDNSKYNNYDMERIERKVNKIDLDDILREKARKTDIEMALRSIEIISK